MGIQSLQSIGGGKYGEKKVILPYDKYTIIKSSTSPPAGTSGVLQEVINIGNNGGWVKSLSIRLGGNTTGSGPYSMTNLLIRITIDDVVVCEFTAPSMTWTTNQYYMGLILDIQKGQIDATTVDPFTFSNAPSSSAPADSQNLYLPDDTLNLNGTNYAFPAISTYASRTITIKNPNNSFVTFNKNFKVSVQATNTGATNQPTVQLFNFYGGAKL